MKTIKDFEPVSYIEIPRRKDAPVKIDEILEARMREFLRVRRTRRFTFVK